MKQTGPLEALSESNAAKRGGSHEVDDGDVGKKGYTNMAYPSAGPATSNEQIAGVKDSVSAMGNDGTSRKSYKIQAETVNAKNPNTGTGNGKA